jgi:hypothetical protein
LLVQAVGARCQKLRQVWNNFIASEDHINVCIRDSSTSQNKSFWGPLVFVVEFLFLWVPLQS